jgi:hypothetical protein
VQNYFRQIAHQNKKGDVERERQLMQSVQVLLAPSEPKQSQGPQRQRRQSGKPKENTEHVKTKSTVKQIIKFERMME